jgi:hypothetical protein
VSRATAVAAVAVVAAALAGTLAALAGRPSRPVLDPQEAVHDGCGRNYTDQLLKKIPTWVYVGDHSAPATGPPPPPQRLEGVISSRYYPDLAVHPTEEDLPPIHRSYDFNFDVLPDPGYRNLLGGDPAQHTGNFAGAGPSSGRVHVEREQGALPRFAWPEKGDRVAIVGSWIWDCGHWIPGGERTEIHSYRALWVQRRPGGPSPLSPYGETEGDLFFSNDKTFAGVEADCAHKVKGDVPAFQSCLKTESEWEHVAGTYRFTLRLPPRPSRRSVPSIRVVDAGSTTGAPRAVVTTKGRDVRVTLTVGSSPNSELRVAKRVLVRWSGAKVPEHLRVKFVRLLVRRAMDPGCPNRQVTCGSKESTHGDQTSAPPGEWNVYVDAAGKWAVWGRGLLSARDGDVFRRGPALDVYVPAGAPWRVFVFTRECDFGSFAPADGEGHALPPCPITKEFGTYEGDDVPGEVINRFASPKAAVGFHRGRPSRHDTTCPSVNRLGCYEIDYTVSRVRDDAVRRRRVGSR